MFDSKNFYKRMMSLSLFLSVWFVAIGFMGPNIALAAGPDPVDLGSAGDFTILAETAITTTGPTEITGDIGISPNGASSITGFSLTMDSSGEFSTSPLVNGKIYAADYAPPTPSKMTTAISDMLTAYNNAAAVVDPAPVNELGGGDISGETLAPGLYKWTTGVNINTDLTLSGGADDVWIFQIAGDLNIASGASVATGTKVILSGGAQASNVFWQVGGGTGATLGTYSTFNGIILSAKQIIIETGAVLIGKALAQTQVTLDAAVVSDVTVCPLITLSPTVLPSGTVNDLYSQTITASGGTGSYTFTRISGTLPAGLSLSSDGVISGTPTTAGTSIFTVRATDANGCAGLHEYTLVINADGCPLISLLPTTLPEGTEGEAYSQMITASGGTEPYTFTMTAGALPSGLSPITSEGLIAGTPTETGTFTFTITATDDNGCTGLQEYTLVINADGCQLITLSPTTLPEGTEGAGYNQRITASGETGTYTFSRTTGALPSGLSFNTETGVISGTPTETGTFTFTITATDAEGCTGLHEYTLVINAAPAIVPASIPTLSEWGMIILMVLIGFMAFCFLRRRQNMAA